MMYKNCNIWNGEDSIKIINRINSLSVTSKGLWGSIQLNEMLEHCSLQLKMTLGEIIVNKNEGTFFLRTLLGKWLALYGPQWKKGVATPSQMNIKNSKLRNAGSDEKLCYLPLHRNSVVILGLRAVFTLEALCS